MVIIYPVLPQCLRSRQSSTDRPWSTIALAFARWHIGQIVASRRPSHRLVVALATMQPVAEAYSAAEIAAEAACPEDRVHWLAATGLIRPDQQGRFTYGDSLALKMVSALLESGLAAETIERAATEGLLLFQRIDEYLPYRPGPRSERTFAEFQADAGPGGRA